MELAELYLVRHGQASFGSDDYDQLSPLGERQAIWLGEYFAQRDMLFDRVVSGAMQRHRQTVAAIFRGMGVTGPVEHDVGLNEYDFQGLFAALGHEHADLKALAHGSPRDFYRGLKQVLKLWSQDRLGGAAPERWADFQQRVAQSRERLRAGGGQRVLVVSSGGVMGVFAQQVLRAAEHTAIELNLQTRNASFSHYVFNAEAFHLASLNNVPHLDQPGRLDSLTYG